jgi:phosphoglycerol transferase MdoB-like AlkP superfamily enzyme
LGKIKNWEAGKLLVRASQPWQFALCLLAFWLLFFAFFRLWFILWLHAEWATELPWVALWQALPLDFSMAGYLMAIPLALWFVGLPLNTTARQFCHKVTSGFNFGVLAILVFVFGANIFVYEEWHTPLNNRAIEYFRTPGAMLDSMSLVFKFGSVLAYVGLTWLWWRMYRYVLNPTAFKTGKTAWNLAWVPVFASLLFLTIRGGLGKMPINESAVYYSAYSFNNHAATNTAWHMVHSLVETRSTQNHYRYMPDALARGKVADLLPQPAHSGPAETWLNLDPGTAPNVVFILMESMTAQVVAELNGEKGICPNLSRLIRDGILGEKIYSSGYRTDQGLVAILGGYPAQPDQSVVLLQDKAAKLPSVPKILKERGYSTAFFYGGQLTFANIGVWLRNQQFETIISETDFSTKKITQRWGADDNQVFQKALQTFGQLKQPFFSTILTLSLHTPYDVPHSSKWSGNTERDKFLNSAVFADKAIGQFFEKAEHKSWYANTLFVLVADHGHPQPNGTLMDDPLARQVPLIFTGPLIHPDWRGKRLQKLGNHHDIPVTVLNEMAISTATFGWSKDLFSEKAKDFAYYSNENGLGWIDSANAGFFRFSGKEWQNYGGKGLDTVNQNLAKAYLQAFYDDYLGL